MGTAHILMSIFYCHYIKMFRYKQQLGGSSLCGTRLCTDF